MKTTICFFLSAVFVCMAHGIENVFHKKNATVGHVIEDGPYGGNGGTAFTDGSGANLAGQPTHIKIRAWDRIDGIQFTYGSVPAAYHGGSGGSENNCDISGKITIVQGRAWDRVDQLEFITSTGQICGPFGGGGGSAWTATHAGCELAYISGSSWDELDAITLHWECED